MHTTIRLWLEGSIDGPGIVSQSILTEVFAKQTKTAKDFLKGPVRKYGKPFHNLQYFEWDLKGRSSYISQLWSWSWFK